ncbi:MAG: adenylate/guanylate cyclase domain-containing protein [Chthoniobacteraceae bacterium]
MPRPGTVTHLLVIAASTLLLAWAQWSGVAWLQRSELAAQDALMRVGRPAPTDPRLVFLARDTASASLEAATDLEQLFDLSTADEASSRALHLMVHEWPWSREVHALVLDRLVQAGARAVVFDFTFPKTSPHDERFRESLDRHRERVVVAGNISDEAEGDASVFSGPTATLIPQTAPRDPRIGFDNFWPDVDGIIRHAHYHWAIAHGVWQRAEELALSARALHEAGLGAFVPPGRDGRRMRFAGPPGTFAPRSIHEIFVPAYWKGNYAGGTFFRDKIVVIGAAGNWQQDEHLTPMGMMPGPEIHLNAINAALGAAFLRETPPLAGSALIFALAGAAALMRRAIRRPHVRLLAQFIGTAAWSALAFLLYDRASLLIPNVGPLLAFNLAGLSGLAFDILLERREKAQLRRTLERYVSRNVVEELVDNPEQFHRALGGELRQVTILFSDIRGFTQKSHDMNSKDLVVQLNEYFSVMVECVFRFNGTLDKFIGDAVMAVWGNTGIAGPATDARNAVACGRAMFEELEKLNARWSREGRPQFQIGIGINTGEVVVGNIGSPQRMEFTVIGDAVNVAWRLQEKTKGEHHLLLGEAVLPLLGDAFPTEIIGEIRPRGSEPVAYGRLVERASQVATADPASQGIAR